MAYLMGIDMGTTSVKTAVFDEHLCEKIKLTADYSACYERYQAYDAILNV